MKLSDIEIIIEIILGLAKVFSLFKKAFKNKNKKLKKTNKKDRCTSRKSKQR